MFLRSFWWIFHLGENGEFTWMIFHAGEWESLAWKKRDYPAFIFHACEKHELHNIQPEILLCKKKEKFLNVENRTFFLVER